MLLSSVEHLNLELLVRTRREIAEPLLLERQIVVLLLARLVQLEALAQPVQQALLE